MKSDETLSEFDERFSTIIIELASLEKEYSNCETALKVMRPLSIEWDVKKIVMRESKDLKKPELHDLFADIKAYKFELGIRTEEEPSTSQPTKALADITSTPTVNEEVSKRKIDDQLNDEAMFLFAQKFSIIMTKNQSKFKPLS